MTTVEADSISDLIDDCTQLPTTLHRIPTQPEDLPTAPSWQVEDTHLAQVHELDEYV